MLKDRYSALSNTERRVFWIVLSLAAVLAAFAGVVFDTLLAAPNYQYAVVNAIPLILAVLSLVSAMLILFRYQIQSSWILLLGALVCLLTAVSQAEGYGLPSAFVLLTITLLVPLQLLEGRNSLAALTIGIMGTISILLVDVFWTLPRVPAAPQDVVSARIASVVLGLTILIALVFQFQDLSIRSKLLILALGTSLASIILVAASASYFTQQSLQQNTRDALMSAAHHSMEQIDSFINFSTYQIISTAQIPDVIAYLKGSNAERAEAEGEIIALFKALAQSSPTSISSYALLDKHGIDVVDTFTQDIGVDKSDRDYFTTPMKNGATFVSPVRFSQTSSDQSFYISTPVFDKLGDRLGVLRVRYRTSILEQLLKNNNGIAGEGSYGILLDEYNIVLAHGTNAEWQLHTLGQPDLATYNLLKADNRVKDLSLDELSLHMPDFSNELANLPRQDAYFLSAESVWEKPVAIGVAQSARTQWKVAYVQTQAAAFQTVAEQRRSITVTALLIGILVALAGFAVARTITSPILSLVSTAEQIAAGDFSARATVETHDEISGLALAFNRMTDRLKDTLGSLEQRVAERTADLDMARLLSERRAQELQSISEISRIISTEQRLDTLLPLIARLVSERFDFYHTGIFLIEETHQFAVLQASNSEGGQKMLARGHRLAVGQTGIVGKVAQTGQPRIALDVGTDAVYFDNPDLPKTRSEMALPLNVRGVTIGALDVQSTKPGAFTEEDAQTLSILADQIAIAIDNARLFGENQRTLTEVQSLYSQYLRQEWNTFTRHETRIGYIQSMMGGKPLENPVYSEEIRHALQKGDVVVIDPKGDKSIPSIVVPIKLRGQTIGILNINAPTPERRWNRDEINMAQAISDRLALALDNARLLFESQRQTAKEQKIGEVTAKIGASINMRNVLQTAVEELGRALPGSEVVIQFQSNGKQE